MACYELLTDEAFSGSTVEEGKEVGCFLHGVEGNWDSHSIELW